MNSSNFDIWNHEAILRASIEYQRTSEQYRDDLIHTEARLDRVTAHRDRLLEALTNTHNLLSEFTTGDSDDPIDMAVDILSAALQEATHDV